MVVRIKGIAFKMASNELRRLSNTMNFISGNEVNEYPRAKMDIAVVTLVSPSTH